MLRAEDNKAKKHKFYLIKSASTGNSCNIKKCNTGNMFDIQNLQAESDPKNHIKLPFYSEQISLPKTHQQLKKPTIKIEVGEETFKEQKSKMDSFMATTAFTNQTCKNWGKGRTRFHSQIDDYMAKKGILSEINYMEEGVKRFGDKYFESTLRDSAKQQPKSPYLYCFRHYLDKKPKIVEEIQKKHRMIPHRNFLKLSGKQIRSKTEASGGGERAKIRINGGKKERGKLLNNRPLHNNFV